MKKINLIIGGLLVLISLNTNAQEWFVPEEDKNKVNPLEFNEENIGAGEELYIANCKACHGDPGKGNYNAALNPTPSDPASEQLQSNTDGELFYILTHGKGALMVSFAPVLSEEERWQVVHFMRSVGEAVDQEVAEIEEGQMASIDVSINDKEELIHIGVTIPDEAGNQVPLANANVIFSVKRFFGNLAFNTAKTDNDGLASVGFPKDIPGDSIGSVDLVVTIEGMDDFEKVVENAPIASSNIPVDIFEKRVMWSYNTNTQWWVILSYLGIVIGVWITIIYVFIETLKLKRLGDKTV